MKKEAGIFIRSLIAVLFSVVLLVTYNFFLLDTSIERIRTTLSDVNQTSHLDEANGATIFLQDLLVSEIGRDDVNLERLVASDAFKGIFDSPGYERKADAQFLLENLLSSYETHRAPYLKWADQFNRFAVDKFYHFLRFLNYVGRKLSLQPQVEEVDAEERQMTILKKARELELKWQFTDAAKAYELFIQTYPDYSKINLIKLYLSSVYLRSGQFVLADEMLSQINLTLASPSELSLIQALKKKESEMKDVLSKRDYLRSEIAELRSARVSGEEAAALRPETGAGVLSRLREKNMGKRPASLTGKLFQLSLYDLYLFDLQAAKMNLQDLLALNPPEEIEKQAKWIQGWVLLLENNYQESRRLMRELFERFPKEKVGALSAFALATIAERTGEYKDAAKEYERLSSVSDSNMVSFLLKYRAGNVYLYNLQDLPKARALFSEAKQLLPSGLLSNFFNSQVVPAIDANVRDAAFQKFFQGDLDAAFKLFEDMLHLNPNDAWANCGYGLALYVRGDKSSGRDYVTKCRSIKNDEYTASSLAYIMESESKKEEAAQLYEEAIKLRPDYLVALYNLARLQIETDRLADAERNLHECKKQSSRYTNYLPLIANNLGVVLWRSGRTEEAVREFQTALRADPDFSEAHFNLSRLYESQGKTDLAIQEMKLARHDSAEGQLGL